MVCVAVCSEDVVQVMNCGLCCCVFRECGTCDELWSAGVDVCSEGVVQVINCGLCCCVFRWCITSDELWSVLLCVQIVYYK